MRSRGDVVVWRSVAYGHIRLAMPHIVVVERDDLIALWLPAGSRGQRLTGPPLFEVAEVTQLDWELQDTLWRQSCLKLHRPGRAHSLWHFWTDEGFDGWYVNLEDPWRRTEHGWDTRDHALDVVVEADGSWRWKDEDHLAAATARGQFNPEQAAAVRSEGERVLAERPWPTGWEDSRPPADWTPPELPAGWDVV